MNPTSHRALFTIPSLRGGGAERVFALVAGALSQRGFDVHLALAQQEGPWLERLPESVTVHNLKTHKVRNAAWPLWKLVRRLRPSTVISTMTHMNILVGLMRSALPAKTRVVLRESTFLHFEESLRGTRPGRLHRAAYRAADQIVCLTDGMCDAFHREFQIPRDRLVRISNPIDSNADGESTAPEGGSSPHLISIGRMDESKGFDRLLEAFPACLQKHPEARLTLLGDGPHREALQQQAESLQIAHRVEMPGYRPDSRRWLATADLFVLASRFEGLPNVLLEAVDAECPVVVLDHPGGTREVLELLRLSNRLTDNLVQWRPEWFRKPHPSTRLLALRYFGLETIVDEYAALIAPGSTQERSAA